MIHSFSCAVRTLGRQVIVENRPGAGGSIGTALD